MLEDELNALNTKISALNYFDDKHGLTPVTKWLEKNAYPLSQKYNMELAVNVYKDLYKLRIGNVVTDELSKNVNEKTVLKSKFGSWRRIAICWHSHPETSSLGRSGFDILMRKHLVTQYSQFQGATFWVTYQDSIKGVITNEY